MLGVVETEVVFQLVLYGDEIVVLLDELVAIHGNDVGIVGCHEHTVHVIGALVGLLGEDVQRQMDNLITVCRIDVGTGEFALLHISNTLVGHAVDAQYLHLSLQLGFADGLVGTHAHGVVVTENDVGCLSRGNLSAHHLISILGVPIAFDAGVVELAMSLHGLGKALMTLLGG